MRLNKFLADAGICSRREADRLILSGQVTVNGQKAEPGMQVCAASDVRVRGKAVGAPVHRFVLAFFKPEGIVCTSEERRGAQNVHEYLKKKGYTEGRIFPIGRLDKDSEGLLLMTNDGDLANEIMKAVNRHEKEYVVRLDQEVTPEFLEQFQSGVRIRKVEDGRVLMDEVTRPCVAEKLSKYQIKVVLTQGLNRQIRRMCQALGRKVIRLTRVRIMNITLEGVDGQKWENRLRPGEYRILTEEEYEALWNACRN